MKYNDASSTTEDYASIGVMISNLFTFFEKCDWKYSLDTIVIPLVCDCSFEDILKMM